MSLALRSLKVLQNPVLSYPQRVRQLAALAEELLDYPPLSPQAQAALERRVICDMHEGKAPYRPRYLLPDYARAMAQGSAYLELPPPQDLDEALDFLLMLYTQVPSITTYPVFVGNIDLLLEPFVEGLTDAQLDRRLLRFWRMLDRLLPDAFVHANLGPHDSRVGRSILRIERQLGQTVPNLTLRTDPQLTPNSYLLEAIQTVFAVAKPHFVNHPLMVQDLGPNYGVVSCYNSLPIGGGAHTLVRLNLKKSVEEHQGSLEDYFAHTLPHLVELTAQLAEARIRFLVEQARFFEHDWLVQEGLLSLDKFSAMFGVFGMAEAVDLWMQRLGQEARYGHHPQANDLALRITQHLAALVANRPMPYCQGHNNRCLLHAQAGIDTDYGVTAGVRVPVGHEPPLFEHLQAVAPQHPLFAAGVSDILHFDDTAKRNPQAVLDILRGAFASGMRDFTFNLCDNDFIRVTGYLVRKSDLAKIEGGARHGSDFWAANSEANFHLTQRAAKRVSYHERQPEPAV